MIKPRGMNKTQSRANPKVNKSFAKDNKKRDTFSGDLGFGDYDEFIPKDLYKQKKKKTRD